MKYIKLTTAQALVRFLDNQYVSFDGHEEKFIEGVFTIFGHGNVLGIGQALEENPGDLKVHQGRNEQGMALAATAFAKQKNRKKIYACTTSVGPGAANMLTAAGTATAAGDGAGITTVPIPFLSAGTSTPVMEVVARKAVINNASSSLSIIGFAQYSGVSADYATMPTNGCYFEASSTAANWWLVSAQGASNKTYTDTGVASSSVTTGTGKFYKFRIQVSTSECSGFIYRHGFDTIKKTNTTNLPTTIVLAPFVTTATVGTAGLSKELHVSSFRVWWRGTNDMLSNGL